MRLLSCLSNKDKLKMFSAFAATFRFGSIFKEEMTTDITMRTWKFLYNEILVELTGPVFCKTI